MFEILNAQTAKLVNYNPRAEKHGKVKRPAATMRVQVVMQARSLDMLAPGLYDSLYMQIENPEDMLATSTRRFSKMAPFAWSFEGKGYVATVDYGLGGESDIELVECTVKNIKVTPEENDIVIYDFNINCAPDERESGILDHRIQQDIIIKLVAPEPQTVQQLFGEDIEQHEEEEVA
ncbi:hypothetical protein [Pandoraea apista]|uniref:hypothetical protein n=1 Tax=Pandoraea apista TaxID=93218 RepID=UPI00065A23AD|nr:hypothetical protein [Pandoraea apista]ALS63595.1 hypothetical protein AT395_00045 [Pandoraea apista]CFB63121.1 hypothetical protein LMG16407_03196 [Pandoraea apista]